MNGAGILIVLLGLILLGASIRGLVNQGRSILCALAGMLTFMVAGLNAWVAWMETDSALGTALYLVIALVGIVSVVRQALPRKT